MNKIKIKIYIFDPNRAGVIGEAIKVKDFEINSTEDLEQLAGWHCVPCICIIQEQRKSEAGERELFLKELEKRCDEIVSGYTNIIDPSLMLDFVCKYNTIVEQYSMGLQKKLDEHAIAEASPDCIVTVIDEQTIVDEENLDGTKK